MLMVNDCRYHLVQAGIAMPDADQLRRIAMTLHRWHELECGDSSSWQSWCIVRDETTNKPFMERHGHLINKSWREPIADRERGAQKRLAKIMARYPDFVAYVQGDPRGASLYIVRKADIPTNADISACYSRGIAVYR